LTGVETAVFARSLESFFCPRKSSPKATPQAKSSNPTRSPTVVSFARTTEVVILRRQQRRKPSRSTKRHPPAGRRGIEHARRHPQHAACDKSSTCWRI
jgi:hypothetical protein